jgi:hypothetical protein
MPYWPPDSPPPPAGIPQEPGAPNAGPAPVPYAGPDWMLAPGVLAPAPDVSATAMPGDDVMAGVTGANYVSEAPLSAPNVNPYEAGATDPVACGESHMGSSTCDTVAGSVAAAVAAAEARAGLRQSETYGQGSAVGDLMTFPASPLDTPAGPGQTDPSGHYYDPPRGYGNEPT